MVSGFLGLCSRGAVLLLGRQRSACPRFLGFSKPLHLKFSALQFCVYSYRSNSVGVEIKYVDVFGLL
jgi:hypothetical protein